MTKIHRTAIRFELIGNQGSGVYLSQAPHEEVIAWLREFYAGRLASVTSLHPESLPPLLNEDASDAPR